jgi:hypothetical protein
MIYGLLGRTPYGWSYCLENIRAISIYQVSPGWGFSPGYTYRNKGSSYNRNKGIQGTKGKLDRELQRDVHIKNKGTSISGTREYPYMEQGTRCEGIKEDQ